MEPFARTINAAKDYVPGTPERLDWNAEVDLSDKDEFMVQLNAPK